MANRPVHRAVTALALLPCLSVASTVLTAQEDPVALLKGATDIRCTFSSTTRTLWRNGEPQPTTRPSTGPVIVIRNINPSSGSALQIREPINKDLTLAEAFPGRFLLGLGVSSAALVEKGVGKRLLGAASRNNERSGERAVGMH